MRKLRFIGLVAVSLSVIGCGGGDGLKRVVVKGKLTAKGQPVDHAGIVFLPTSSSQALGGVGRTDDQGNFTVRSSTADRQYVEGLVAGEYQVWVSRLIMPDGKPRPDGATDMDYPDWKQTVPAKYAGSRSPLKATVPESGEVKVDIPEPLIIVKGGVSGR